MPQKTKLLFVDDNPANLAILEETFLDEFDYRTAENGEEALRAASEYRPDIVLLDIMMMPGIDGYEVCRRLRAMPECEHVKVIMVSARALVAERLKAYEIGADDYVTKPFDPPELYAKVQVYRKLKRIEEVGKLKNDVFTLLLHQVQTPLRAITAPADLLKSEPSMSQEQRRRLGDVIFSNAQRLKRFFAKVRLLSEIRSGTFCPRPERLDLRDVAAKAVREAAPAASARGVKVVETYEDPGTVLGDPTSLEQAIAHVLENAIRYSFERGTVHVQVSRDGDAVFLSIADRGRGIPEALLPNLFVEFVDVESRGYHEGPGISLALAREIVVQHGGDIEARSSPGEETVFTLRLPSGAPARSPRPQLAPASSAAAPESSCGG